MKLQLIRNSTICLEYAGVKILTDPFFAKRHSLPTFVGIEENPTVELPLAPEKIIEDLHLVIASHLHIDHFDPAAQQILPKSLPIFCCPGDEQAIRDFGFTNVSALEKTMRYEHISITPTSGQHGSGTILEKMGNVIGFILQAPNEPTVYWVGDTILVPEVLATIEQMRPDIIITNSGGAILYNTLLIMDVAQTLEVCKTAKNAVVIATHLESLDHLTVSRVNLRTAANNAGILESQLRIPKDGEVLEF